MLQYLPPSIYDTSSGWSIDYYLNYGEADYYSPSQFTSTITECLARNES